MDVTKIEIPKRQDWLAVTANLFNLNKDIYRKYVVRNMIFNKFYSGEIRDGGYIRLAFSVSNIKIYFSRCSILENQIWIPFKQSDISKIEGAYFDALQIETEKSKEDTFTLSFNKFPESKHIITLEWCPEAVLMDSLL